MSQKRVKDRQISSKSGRVPLWPNGCGRGALLRLLVDMGSEVDATAFTLGWDHELSDGGEDGGDGVIVVGELFIELC